MTSAARTGGERADTDAVRAPMIESEALEGRMGHCSRRNFLKAGLAAAAMGGISRVPVLGQAKQSATDWVTLGKSGRQGHPARVRHRNL